MVNAVFSGSVEPEHYPGTTVYVNLLGISGSKEFRDKEAGFTAIRSLELLQKPDLIPQTFDFKHLKAIHLYLFQDIYEWAGSPRSYDVKKDISIFTPANELPKYEAKAFEKSVNYFNRTQRPSLYESAIILASCLGIINSYHPFPEGNGRTQRIFISSLANVFQYFIDWSNVSPWEVIETSKQAHSGDYASIENLIERIIVDKRKEIKITTIKK